MKTYSYTVGMMPNIILPLGIQGEHLTREIRIDFSEWLEDGTEGYPVLIVLTPDGTTYPAATNREDEEQADGTHSVLVWPVTNVDTAEYGDGAVRLLLYGTGGEILKSQAGRTSCAPSLIATDDVPDQYESWLETLTEKAASVGADRAIVVKCAESAAASEAAALAYAIAIREGETPQILTNLMNLATAVAVSLPAEDWTYDSTEELYTQTITNTIITEGTAAILMMDDTSAGNAAACIIMDTGDGEITFSTATLPTGDLAGTLILNGRFAADEEG